jgi:nitric oxide reductase subunit C
MAMVLVMLTADSLAVISPGGAHVPPYTVINRHIDYKFDPKRGHDMPAIGEWSRCSASWWTDLPHRR